MVGNMKDQLWVHLGARPPDYASRLVHIAGGAMLQVSRANRSRNFLPNGLPFAFQHDGSDSGTQLSFISEEKSWLLCQAAATVLCSPVRWLSAPAEGGLAQLQGVVDAVRAFITVAELERPDLPRLGVFALDYRWLSTAGPRERLLNSFRSLGSPVGLMLGKHHDPLDNAHTVEGLASLSAAVDELLILRCDHGALGALAFGASGGSIGSSTSTRHFVPPGGSTWKDVTDPTPRVFVPSLLEWWKGSRLGYLADDPLFQCWCAECDGASLGRFQDESLKPEADAHSVRSWTDLAKLIASEEPDRRADRWITLCRQAYARLDELEDRRALLQAPSRQLKAWLRFAGVPAA
jgi:hypothetical protein